MSFTGSAGASDPSLSPLIRSLPWFSTFIVEESDRLKLVPDDLKVTARLLLDAYKDTCLNERSRSVFDNREALQPLQKSAGPVATLLFGFRFLDIASLVNSFDDDEESSTDVTEVRIPDLPMLGRSPFNSTALHLKGVHSLSNKNGWPQVVFDVASRFQRGFGAVSPTLNTVELRLQPQQQLLHAAFRQLHTLCDRQSKITLQKQLFNIEAAAFFMNWLFQGNKDFPEHSMELFDMLNEKCATVDVKLDFQKTFASREKLDVHHLRQPLFLSLAVSPLALLCEISAVSVTTNRVNLIKAWFHYGNARPRNLWSVECSLWRALFAVARGYKTSIESLGDFLRDAVPLLDVSDDERFFFRPENGSPRDLPQGIADGDAHPETNAPAIPPGIDWVALVNGIISQGTRSAENDILPVLDLPSVLAFSPAPTEITGEPSISSTPITADVAVVDESTNASSSAPIGNTGELSITSTEANTEVADECTITISPAPTGVTNDPPLVSSPPTTDATAEAPTEMSNDLSIVSTPAIADITDESTITPTPAATGVTAESVSNYSPDAIEVDTRVSDTQLLPTPTPGPKPKGRKAKSEAKALLATETEKRPLRNRKPVVYTETADYSGGRRSKSNNVSLRDDTVMADPEEVSTAAFNPISSKPRVFGETYLLAGLSGKIVLYRPAVYSPTVIAQIDTLFSRANRLQSLSSLCPMFTRFTSHLYEPSSTANLCIPHAVFGQLDQEGSLPARFTTNIVVYGAKTPSLPLNAALLSKIGSFAGPRQVHDLSLREDAGSADHQIVVSTFKEFLRQVSKGDDGKIMNFLDIPGTDDRYVTPSISTNMFSHRYTMGFPKFLGRHNQVPVCDIYWHLVATAHANHHAHVDANGFATELYVETGVKLVFIGFPDKSNPYLLAEATAFCDFQFDMSGPDSHDIAGFLLFPGDRFFMQPCTPHYVVTIEPSICHGSHFFAAGTMDRSLWGVVHTFFRDHEITNQEHPVYHELLFRMAMHWHDVIVNDTDGFLSLCVAANAPLILAHVPNVYKVNGLIQLFSLVALIEFGTLLAAERYDGSGKDRLRELEGTYSEIRALCTEILSCLDRRIAFEPKKRSLVFIADLARSFLVQHVLCLLQTAKASQHDERKHSLVEKHALSDLKRSAPLFGDVSKLRGGGKVSYGVGLQLAIPQCQTFRWAFADILARNYEIVARDPPSDTDSSRAAKRRRVISPASVPSSDDDM
ncbi:hypothetical protein VNI00_017606 [Paramarasmius palmivorus]|uniref:JmjC domain-containing protein n=1 Tax=Paramarasmius palmivorus TaxID=297713 RepID=A0AAW0B4Z1_9AGAR